MNHLALVIAILTLSACAVDNRVMCPPLPNPPTGTPSYAQRDAYTEKVVEMYGICAAERRAAPTPPRVP